MRSGRDLVISGVRKRFGAVSVLGTASGGVSQRIRAGEFVTLLGPSGCGKTTLLRIVAGLETADEGSVRLGEEELLDKPANRREVNMVFQSYALFPHLTVAGNVEFGLRARGVGAAEARRRAGEAMEMLRIGELAGRKPGELSGGQRQRVAVARAVVNEPEVLLLDEPMSALDAKLRAEVQGELRRLQRRLGRTFVLVTHDQDEAMSVSDRVLVMDGGRIVQEGSPEAVYERPGTRFVATFLGAANVLAAQRVGTRRVQTAVGELEVGAEVPWERGWVMFRPERARLSSAGISGVVEEVTYRGDHRDLSVRASGELIRVRVNSAEPVTTGQRVWVQVPSEDVGVLEGEVGDG
jgi:spermidine/putrescine transport system ATP-binding protein